MNIYDMAVDSQTACNTSGLIKSLAKALDDIWAEGGGTKAVNEHPVIRLFLEQIAFLNGCAIEGGKYSWTEAWEICNAKKERKA